MLWASTSQRRTRGIHTPREIWGAAAATFASKLIMALTFMIPVLLFPLDTAVIVAIV
jgi:vacuolar iron transporter family protein